MLKTAEWPWLLCAAVISLAFCYVWAGPVVLLPTSVEWLDRGDRAMHTLGWWFFQEAPWGWPPGASPKLGLELASSVALSDSLPLFAFPFKLLSPLLPPVFQYWGIWMMLCIVLQAVFGYLLGRELRLGKGLALVAALFCVFQPAFLARLPGHMALGGHWTILAALYLYVRREPPPRLAWPLLLGLTAAVHGYLMVLCTAIWLGALGQRVWLRQITRKSVVIEGICGIAAMFAVMWASGVFMVRSLGSSGYGFFKLNLLSLLDSAGWSRIFPDLPDTRGSYEGMFFLGAGVLLLAGATAIAVLVFRAPSLNWSSLYRPRWLPLVVVGAGLTVFAISHHVSFASFELPALPLPAWTIDFANIFRSSGRMFWPVGYLLIFVVLLAASRALQGRAIWLALPLLLVQIADTANSWGRFRPNGEPQAEWSTALKDPAWDILASRYERLRRLPVQEISPNWKELSYLALRHNVGTDAVYLGRLDRDAFAALQLAETKALAEGVFDRGALYVMHLGAAVMAHRHVRPGDLMTELDGLYVFAPDGVTKLREAGLAVPERLPQALPLAPNVPIVTDLEHGEEAGEYMPTGWSNFESWGRWTEETEATFVFSMEPLPNPVLHLLAEGMRQPNGSPQRMTVLADGVPIGEYELPAGKVGDVAVRLPPGTGGTVILTLVMAEPSRPSDRDWLATDRRLLGLALRQMELRSE